MIRFAAKPGLVIYVTCGDPDLQTTRRVILAAIDAGADVIELGVPFSDPLADGPVIQRASERALKNGTSLQDVLSLGAQVRRERPKAGLIVFSYLNPIVRFGVGKFAQRAKAAGFDGALVTDLTLEEAGEYRAAMKQHSLCTIFLAAPTSPDARLKQIAAASSGFIYAVSRTGVTGTQQPDMAGEARLLVERIRRYSSLPVALGFGVAGREQFRQAGRFADAAVVGTAIVRLIEESPGRAAHAVADWIQSLR